MTEQFENNALSDSNQYGVNEKLYTDIQPEDVDIVTNDTINEGPVQVDDGNYPPLPECLPPYDVTKFSDDGYNSETCYSGETPKEEVNQSLLNKPCVDDDVKEEVVPEYAVPEFTVDVRNNTTAKSEEMKRKRKLFRGLICGSTYDPTAHQARDDDDAKEKYYNPPVDVRDNYFLPKNDYPLIRVLLSLTIALAASFTALFLMLVSLNPLLSFVIAFVLFIIVFVIPMTLLHQGLICVITLLIPSMFSARMKIAGFSLLVVLIIIGPVIGTANKLNIAATCDNNKGPILNFDVREQSRNFIPPNVAVNPRIDRQISSSSVQEKCVSWFHNVTEHCHSTYDKFQEYCSAFEGTSKSNIDERLCRKSRDEFCRNNSTLSSCSVHKAQNLETAEDVRRVLFYLLPVLLLILFRDAYVYNKVYLATKYCDNIYITQRLKEFDNERRSRGLTDLILPLTRIEFQTYLVRGRLSLSKTEKTEVRKWFGILLLFCLLSLCFVLLEDRIHSVLLCSLVTSPCKDTYQANTGIEYRRYIYLTLGIFLLLVAVQSYMLRLRSVICDQFYPDMVGIRAKHLYYKILHDRNTFGRHIRRKVQLLAEAKRLSRRISCMNMIYHVLPDSMKDMCRTFSVKKCMICDSIAYRKTVECSEANCRAHYCYECFVDSGQQCLTCKMPATPTSHAPMVTPL